MQQVSEYWLFGLGGRTPHHWGGLIDGRKHVDVVNNFIIVAIDSGILGLFLHLTILGFAIYIGVRRFKEWGPGPMGQISFTLISLLISVSLAGMAVGFYGPPLLMYFITLGMLCTPIPKPKDSPDDQNQSPQKAQSSNQTSWEENQELVVFT